MKHSKKKCFMKLAQGLGGVLLLVAVGSCGKKPQDDLVLKIVPTETLVLELNAYSCDQIIEGINNETGGGVVDPSIRGPVVLFNRMSMQWKKNTKLIVHQAKIRFTGVGLQGGESSCELTQYLNSFFESEEAIGVRVPAVTSADPTENEIRKKNLFLGGMFMAPGTITSNPRCRIACPLSLANPDRPEISASGELTVKASELTNEGAENEKYYRVKSTFRIRVVP